MARFALFTNGVKVDTLDELKENFSIKDMLENYRNKALHRWLMMNRINDKLSLVEAITATEDVDLIDELSRIFEVSSAVIEKQKYRSGLYDSNKIIENKAILAADGDCEIGKIIADAIEKVGQDGIILTEESKSEETKIDIVEGISIDKNYFTPIFISNAESMTRQLEDAYILICENAISDIYEILPVLQVVLKTGKPFFIIADDVTDSALKGLEINQEREILNVCAIKISTPCEYRRAILEDIAILFGGTLISHDCGFNLKSVGLEELGQAKRILIDGDNITIIGGDVCNYSKIFERIRLLKKQIAEVTDETVRKKLQDRLKKLAGGIAIIKVGAATETKMQEKRERINEALKATRKAMEKWA